MAPSWLQIITSIRNASTFNKDLSLNSLRAFVSYLEDKNTKTEQENKVLETEQKKKDNKVDDLTKKLNDFMNYQEKVNIEKNDEAYESNKVNILDEHIKLLTASKNLKTANLEEMK